MPASTKPAELRLRLEPVQSPRRTTRMSRMRLSSPASKAAPMAVAATSTLSAMTVPVALTTAWRVRPIKVVLATSSRLSPRSRAEPSPS